MLKEFASICPLLSMFCLFVCLLLFLYKISCKLCCVSPLDEACAALRDKHLYNICLHKKSDYISNNEQVTKTLLTYKGIRPIA